MIKDISQISQRRRPRKKARYFPIFLIVYAIIALFLTNFGLQKFWDYIDAYEASRPHIATDAYMAQLTPEYVIDQVSPLLDEVDPAIQSREEAIEVLKNALSKPFTCSKWTNQSTDTKWVYVLRSGPQVIGTFQMEPAEEGRYGMFPWKIAGDSLDLSFLLKEGFSVTVPHDATVSVGGKVLGEAQITKKDIPYTAISDLYDLYELPTRVTYTVGRYLGELETVVTDAKGNPIDANADPEQFLDNCSDEEKAVLKTVGENFTTSYIHFTSRTGGSLYDNLDVLRQYMIPGGSLEKRMEDSIPGFSWITDRHVKIQSVTVNRSISIGNGRYICDVTCIYDTTNIHGNAQEELKLKIVFLETDNGLRAEAMQTY